MSYVVKYFGFSALFVVMTACGGGGDGGGDGAEAELNDNPPSVAGDYLCIQGCDGPVCDFADEVEVIQNGSNVILRSDRGDSVGTINNDGEFTTDDGDSTCEGTIIDGVAVATCDLDDGTQCQAVTYEIM